MPAEFDHPADPNRNSDKAIVIIMVATIVSAMWITFWSVMTALGSGLASTPDSPVPRVSSVLWMISGFSFLPCIVLYFATFITRRRRWGIALGFVVLASGLALAGGQLIGWAENPSDWSALRLDHFKYLAVPVVASAMIFWASRGLLSWGSRPYLK